MDTQTISTPTIKNSTFVLLLGLMCLVLALTSSSMSSNMAHAAETQNPAVALTVSSGGFGDLP